MIRIIPALIPSKIKIAVMFKRKSNGNLNFNGAKA
jgi:hypothetical protein